MTQKPNQNHPMLKHLYLWTWFCIVIGVMVGVPLSQWLSYTLMLIVVSVLALVAISLMTLLMVRLKRDKKQQKGAENETTKENVE